MPLHIEIKDEHAKEMIEFYVQKQRDIKTKIFDLEKQSKEVTAIIQQLNQSLRESEGTIKPMPSNSVYSDKWTWVRKLKFAIEQAGKPITTREIFDLLSEYEPTLIYNRKKAIASVSSVLSVKTGEYFKKVDSEGGENTYTLLEEETQKNNEHFGTNIEIDDLPF